MTSPSATRQAAPADAARPATKGGGSPLRHWPWALLAVALLALLIVGWSATAWYPEHAGSCAEPGCEAAAGREVITHWAGMAAAGLAVAAGLLACLRSRSRESTTFPARLSPMWHGAVVGIVVMVLATFTLWPTVRVGMLSPPLGLALLAVEWVLLALALDRMHLAARPATAPRRRLLQSLVVAACVVVLEVALPLVSPFRALSAGMLQIALVQAGVALALTTWLSLRDPAGHGDAADERRTARLAALGMLVVVVTVAVTGLHLGPGSAARFGHDLADLVHPW
ncbi:hypothetical protein NMQ01_00415 [Janibacter sp. CX7]|uniref:hypothetical protein n=1 Tax=Janibacter sp. CX7 TaxID=2963431 RepID=UPI0020CC4E21|nr:hypothetical protein [Janibacter sp. CX7]UTT66217.1 hypothetical protein NMQ01_00415 [Janibacter sp. CX7]